MKWTKKKSEFSAPRIFRNENKTFLFIHEDEIEVE